MTRRDFDKPSHFICSDKCKFGMTTVVNDRYIVSSVGDYRVNGKRERLGAGPKTYYETLIFKFSHYCEIAGCTCGGIPEPLDWSEIDGKRFATEAECRDGHAAFVEKYEAL